MAKKENKKKVFLKIQLHLHLWAESQTATPLCQPNQRKAHGASISEHLNFWSIPFQLTLVYWILLHPKKAIFLLFWGGQTPHFISENQKPESWVRHSHFEPEGGGPSYTKKSGAIFFFSHLGGSQVYTVSYKASYSEYFQIQLYFKYFQNSKIPQYILIFPIFSVFPNTAVFLIFQMFPNTQEFQILEAFTYTSVF